MPAYSKNKKWLLMLFPAFLCMLFVLGAQNYIVDPYGFFRKDLTRQLIVPNENFLKMRYITGTATPFNSFLFGSSRVGNIPVKSINNGGHWYNMTYAGGIPHDHLQNIEYMIKKGMKIRELLIGLDEFSYSVDPETRARQWLTKPYSPVLGESELLCYAQYLIRLPDIKVLQAVYKEYQIRKRPELGKRGTFFSRYDFYGTGQGSIKELDDEIARNPEKHCRNKKFLIPYLTRGDNADFSGDALASMRRIVELSRSHGIKLTVFINPIHHVTYMATNNERLFKFKRELSGICNYYDFSGLNDVTRNNLDYYETSHYRPIVGGMIIRRIFAGNRGDSSFGELVTSETVERHIAQQRYDIRRYASRACFANPSRGHSE